ncbi:MAG: efflux RND transporter periplasmic adaptor subunit [Gammaproteobacteria bacterium]|nr:MAG: efflux RND transporter periplasmic adaptor subunit [Gammaproteobacteria bacterium]
MKKTLIALSLAAVAAVALWWFSRDKPVTVHVQTAERGTVEAIVANTRTGTIKACQRSRLSMPIGGVVDQLLVNEGDRVEAGQVLLTLWNKDRTAHHERAKAAAQSAAHAHQQSCLSADQASREYKRIKALHERKLTSQESLEAAETLMQTSRLACEATKDQADMAKAELVLSESQLEQTILRAPFAGVIGEINGEIGEYITPSPPGVATPPAVDLIDSSCLYVTAPIDEIDAARLQQGQPARITLDAFGDRVFTGKLTRIAPYVLEIEKQARTVDVDVHFDALPEDAALLVGYSADVEVILESRDGVLRIPSVAVFDSNHVLRVNNDRLQKHTVRTGLANWHYTEVLEGLAEGDRVVTSLGQQGVEDGALIEAVEDTP